MPKKINSLQSMRLFAALMVFQYHMWNNYLDRGFFEFGTDLFIVLAGLIAAVAHSSRIPEGNWGRYMWKRYLRIYVTFIPVFTLYALVGRDPYEFEFFIKSFFFIPIANRLPLVGPTWILSLILIFYWLFSLAFIFRRERILIPVFALWGTGCLAYSWFQWNPGLPVEWSNILFNHRNIEFIFGYLGGKVLITQEIKTKAGGWLVALGTVVIIPGIIFLNNEILDLIWRTFLIGIPITLVFLGLGIMERNNSTNRVTQALTHPWLAWLGCASYVLYLIHNMILRIWDTAFPITLIQTPLITVIVIGLSSLGYAIWENPVLAYLHKRTL